MKMSAFFSQIRLELEHDARATGDMRLAGDFELREADNDLIAIVWREFRVGALIDPSNPEQRRQAVKAAFDAYDRAQLEARQARNRLRRLLPRVRGVA